MSRALMSVEVFRDSGRTAVVTVYDEGRRIDRVTVTPGDCLDLELEEGMGAVVRPMAARDEDIANFEAQGAVLRAELEDVS